MDDGWVVRSPRRQVAVPLIEREARVLPVLGRQLPLPIPMPEWHGEPTDAFPWPWLGTRGRVVHGDLYARHLMVDHGALSGVIDWGDVHLGHPGLDLVPLWTVLPDRARPAFFAAYGPVDDETWWVSRLRALWSSAMLVSYGQDVGDDPLVRAGVCGLHGVLRA